MFAQGPAHSSIESRRLFHFPRQDLKVLPEQCHICLPGYSNTNSNLLRREEGASQKRKKATSKWQETTIFPQELEKKMKNNLFFLHDLMSSTGSNNIFEICFRSIFSLVLKGNNEVGIFWQSETVSETEHFQQIILMEKIRTQIFSRLKLHYFSLENHSSLFFCLSIFWMHFKMSF